jgi:chromosome segregation ATPase
LLRDGNAKGILVTHEQDKNKFQQQLLQSMQSKLQKATAEVPRWTKQLEEAAAQQGAMKERLKTLEQELRTTKEAVQAANTSVERLQKNDQDASLVIDQLRANIQQLQDANSGLEADLDTYQDINAKQAQLALNRATRMRGWSAGVKREIKEEDDGASRTPTKRPKLGNVITTQVEGAVVID